MFQKFLNLFGDEKPKEKILPELFVNFTNKDAETKII